MKKFVGILLSVLMLLSTCFLPSCAGIGVKDYAEEETNQGEEKNALSSENEIPPIQNYIKGWIDGCVYGNYFFFTNRNGKLVYQKLDAIQNDPFPVYSDLLAEGIDDPFSSIGAIDFIAVDTAASAANGGVPVLILATTKTSRIASSSSEWRIIKKSQIASFDMANQKLTVLKSNIEGSLMSLAVHKDRILYCVSEGENGWSMHSIRASDGQDEKTMENPNKYFYRLFYAAEGRIYYWREDERVLCSCDMNFENVQTLFPIELVPEMFVFDGKIYYATNRKVNEEYTSFDIRYRDLADLTKEETLLTDITVGMNWENYFYYYSAENVFTFENNHDSFGGTKLYCVDIKTGLPVETVYEKEEGVYRYSYHVLGEKYVVYRENHAITNETKVVVIDLATKKETLLPGTAWTG